MEQKTDPVRVLRSVACFKQPNANSNGYVHTIFSLGELDTLGINWISQDPHMEGGRMEFLYDNFKIICKQWVAIVQRFMSKQKFIKKDRHPLEVQATCPKEIFQNRHCLALSTLQTLHPCNKVYPKKSFILGVLPWTVIHLTQAARRGEVQGPNCLVVRIKIKMKKKNVEGLLKVHLIGFDTLIKDT